MDRNNKAVKQLAKDNGSLSARRAWIEIFIKREMSLIRPVALRKESVDRNICDHLLNIPAGSRSPQGERG